MKKYIRKIFPDKRTAIVSAIIGISTGLAIYLGKLQRHFFSKTYSIYAVLISVLATILVAWLRQCCLRSKFLSLSRRMRTISLVFTVLVVLILLANVQIQPLYYALPDSDLQIHIPIGDVPEGHEGVRLLWVETGQGYVHYTHMGYAGKWERVFGNTIFEPDQDVTITWSGKVGPVAEIVFRMTPFDQPVFISWNGEEVEYNLNNPQEPKIFIRTSMDIPIWYKLPFILSFTISVGFLVFTLLILLATWQPHRGTKRLSGKYTWLLYMLPMVLVWGFSLLVFWPGIMSNDSVTLWSQNLVGEYSDWQSAFYALMLAALMKIWYSPALIVILQMLTLAFLTAWGLKAFEDRGAPRLYLWVISLLFAILPVNNLFIITLWRDIPYAIAVFWMTIIILKIYFSQGEWLKGLGWLWLALSGFLIAVLRQNGIPVAFVVLALLPIIYRKYWKRLSASLLLCAALLLFMKGPVFDWLNVDRSKSGQSNLILAHHIAAHLDAGTPLKTDEEQYLNAFMPVDDWYYYCCYVGTVSYDSDFAREEFLNSSAENRKLVLDLFLRDPLVDVRHMLCSGEMVWKYMNNQCIMKSVHGFNSWVPGETSWIIPNDAGLKEASRIPGLVQPYIDILGVFGFRDDFLMIYLRPALYMYLSAVLILVFSLRSKDFRPFLVVMPVLAQSAILFLISYAPAIRYQYSNYMIGLYLLGLLLLPGVRTGEDETRTN